MMQARQWHMALLLGAALGTTMVGPSERERDSISLRPSTTAIGIV